MIDNPSTLARYRPTSFKNPLATTEETGCLLIVVPIRNLLVLCVPQIS